MAETEIQHPQVETEGQVDEFAIAVEEMSLAFHSYTEWRSRKDENGTQSRMINLMFDADEDSTVEGYTNQGLANIIIEEGKRLERSGKIEMKGANNEILDINLISVQPGYMIGVINVINPIRGNIKASTRSYNRRAAANEIATATGVPKRKALAFSRT